MSMIRQLRRVQKKHEKDLLKIAGIIGVSIEPKITKGRLVHNTDGQPAHCLRVYVKKKSKRPESRIPKYIDGVPTDVIEGNFVALGNAPVVMGGTSVGNPEFDYGGTLGAVVYDLTNSDNFLLLTCYHVLCPTDHFTEGNPVIQPSLVAGGTASNVIGRIRSGELSSGCDAIVADLSGVIADFEIIENIGGHVAGSAQAKVGDRVIKMGQATGLTQGTVINIDFAATVSYPTMNRDVTHFGQILIESDDRSPFAEEGDSGAVILDENKDIVGLLIAGDINSGRGIANHAGAIAEKLGIGF